ncbi:hypothetical protein [Nonomuraea wenchangensis]|uniref:hypothetical protein n=1 Tax=Nonomuraea wenchangensis TaxID=568860 RepID=UPI003317FBB3
MLSLRRSGSDTLQTRPPYFRLARRLLTCAAAVVTVAGLLVAPATAADSFTALGVYPQSITPDVTTGAGKVFVSVGDQITVSDTQGSLTGAITGLPGVKGLVTTPDGTRLYAALSGSNQVAEIDTGSLAEIRRIDLAAYLCPSTLSMAGGRLYVGYGCSYESNGGVLSLDVAAASPEPIPIEARLFNTPLVAAAGQTLVVGITGLSPGALRIYDISGADATFRGVVSGHTYSLSNLQDISISTDGSTVYSAFGAPARYDAWNTADMTLIRSYQLDVGSRGGAKAVAVSPDGAHLLGVTSSDLGVAVYDTTTAEKTFTYKDRLFEISAGSLVFTGRDVFGVVRESGNASGRIHLLRLPDVTLAASTLTLTAPAAGTILQPLTLEGRLSFAGGATPGERSVVVTRRLPDGTRQPLPEITTATDGTFSITDTPQVSGTITYDALWDGSPDFRWSRASAAVTIAKVRSSVSWAPAPATTLFEPFTWDLRLSLADGSAPGAQRVVVTRQLPDGTIEPLPEITTAADGTFSITDTPQVSGMIWYEVRWAGDSVYDAARSSHGLMVAKLPATLQLTGPETTVVGRRIELSGRLDTGDRLPSSGTSITVHRTVTNRNGTVTTTLPSPPLAGDGSFGFTDTPQTSGEYTYTVKWVGDAIFLPAEHSHVVVVRGPLS